MLGVHAKCDIDVVTLSSFRALGSFMRRSGLLKPDYFFDVLDTNIQCFPATITSKIIISNSHLAVPSLLFLGSC